MKKMKIKTLMWLLLHGRFHLYDGHARILW
jgi:hypothetical protein